MRSSWASLVFRHTLACQASRHNRSVYRLFSSAKFSQHKRQDALAETAPVLSSSSNFAVLAGSSRFVDKSSALQDFLRFHIPIHLLLRPRRSGRTTLLSMFRAFFESASLDELAHRKELFTKNDLAITKDAGFEKEFGQYPVLYVNFSVMIGSTMAELLQNFRTHVTAVCWRLEDSGFFQNRDELPKNQRQFLEAVLNNTVPDSHLSGVLFNLTEILHVLHRKQVVVLIDEYDTPMFEAVQHGYASQANVFFRLAFSGLLKDNKNIRGALLVGILHAKPGFLSGINIVAFPLGQSSHYSSSCMFTEDETRMLYDRQVRLRQLPFEFGDLKKWYNGYSTADGINLYNPWSISNALTRGILVPHWNELGYDVTIQARITELLDRDDEFCAQCQTLLEGNAIHVMISEVEYSSVAKMSKDELWIMMYYAGYLTTTDTSRHERTSLRIPNAEIQFQFRACIRKEFHGRMTPGLGETSVGQFNLMVNGHFAEFAESFGKFFFTEPRIFGGLESVYQEYVYTYFSSAARAFMDCPKWTTRMEVIAGLGRVDIAFHDELDVGVIVEVKCIAHDKKEGYRDQERKLLSRKTEEALSQFDTRHYRAMMPRHVNTICEYGLTFLGPYCGVEARLLKKENGTWVTKNIYSADEDEKRRRLTYCIDGLISDGSTTSKKGRGGSRKRDGLMVVADAITGRNLFAKFYLETHMPTVAEFADVWKHLDNETVEEWKTRARQMKRAKEKKTKKEQKESTD